MTQKNPPKILPALVYLLVAVQAIACLWQLEWWPLTGHGLYSESLNFRQMYFHQFKVRYSPDRVERGMFLEIWKNPANREELHHWCGYLKARPGFIEVSATVSRYLSESNGSIVLHRDEPEDVCGS